MVDNVEKVEMRTAECWSGSLDLLPLTSEVFESLLPNIVTRLPEDGVRFLSGVVLGLLCALGSTDRLPLEVLPSASSSQSTRHLVTHCLKGRGFGFLGPSDLVVDTRALDDDSS